MAMVNEHLLEQARQGDASALSILYRRFLPAIFGYITLRVPDRATAEDLTSEVFLQMIASIHRLKATDEASFIAWLLRIACVTVAGYYRKRARQPMQVPAETWEEPVLTTTCSSYPDDLARGLEEQERWNDLVQAMNRLTEEQRQVLVARFILGYDVETVARVLGKKANAVKSLQFRAFQRLRRFLGKTEHALPWQIQKQHSHL